MRLIVAVSIILLFSCNYKTEKRERGRGVLILNNDLAAIPDSIFAIPNLSSLIISCEGYTSYPSLHAFDTNEVRYHELPLEKIPEQIGQLTNLTKLVVNGTRIQNLPSSLIKLTNLDTLDLSLNKHLDVSSEINKIMMLRHLKLLNIYQTKLDSSKINLIRDKLNKKTELIFTYEQLRRHK